LIKLSSNGKELGRKNWSVAQFPVPARTAWYDLTLDVERADTSWATTSTATRTEWRFRSGPTKSREVLPLVQVDYQLRDGWLDLKPGYQPGARGIGFFRTTAEISYDGKTWQWLTVIPRGSTVSARIPAARPGSPSLRVTATDLAGNRISQTIEEALPAAK